MSYRPEKLYCGEVWGGSAPALSITLDPFEGATAYVQAARYDDAVDALREIVAIASITDAAPNCERASGPGSSAT